MVWGFGFRVWDLGFWGFGFLGFGVWGFGFGFRVWGFGFRVRDLNDIYGRGAWLPEGFG